MTKAIIMETTHILGIADTLEASHIVLEQKTIWQVFTNICLTGVVICLEK